jgi:hypothetical protein
VSILSKRKEITFTFGIKRRKIEMLMKRMMCLWSVAAFMAFMGFSGITFAGDLEPSAPPDTATGKGTMKTLDEIPPTWSQILLASERFELVLDDAAVLDKETGLVWDRSPDTTPKIITDARLDCYNSEVGGRKGWHLPTLEQLASLVDLTQTSPAPALPSGYDDFFSNVATTDYYWSGTFYSNFKYVKIVEFSIGAVYSAYLGSGDLPENYAWCVRGGQVYDGKGDEGVGY